MKRKILLLIALASTVICLLAISSSAATYYVDKDGNLVEEGSAEIAYQFTTSVANSVSYVSKVYLHDTTTTKLIFPELAESGSVRYASWSNRLAIYDINEIDSESPTDLATQIKEIVFCGNTSFDGANGYQGSFMNYTGLEKMTFYKDIQFNNSGCLYGCSSIKEIHFYGENLKINNTLCKLPSKNVTIVFHENASGTISTGADVLPTVSTLSDWKLIINPNIKPSNSEDTRLGKTWGQVTTTTGWELIVAVNPSLYTEEELEQLKTSHNFCSRASSIDSAVVKEATVMSYCDAIYNGEHTEALDDGLCTTAITCERCGHLHKEAAEHSYTTTISYDNGYNNEGKYVCDCTNDGCNNADVNTTASPIFKTKGYSINENGSYGITTGYDVNVTALAEYEAYLADNEKTFKFGLIMANATTFGNSFIEDGKLSNSNGIQLEVTTKDYSRVNATITDFTTAEKDLKLVMALYVIEDGKVSYIQHDGTYEDEITMGDVTLDIVTITKIAYLTNIELALPEPKALPAENKEN